MTLQSIINPTICGDNSTDWGGREWFHENIKGSDTLVITVGDSWTWGDSLGKINKANNILDDYENRVTSIYGHHLSNSLNSDFVNLAICGTNNIWMIETVISFINNINKTYKKIYVVLTLTEVGRELKGYNLHNQIDIYNKLKGNDWPLIDKLLVNPTLAIRLIEECKINDWFFESSLLIFNATAKSSNQYEFLLNLEAATFNLIVDKFSQYTNVEYIVGRNFTASFDENKNILGENLIESTWTETIAEQGNINKYPTPVYLMSGMAIEPFIETIEQNYPQLVDKQELLHILDSANEAIDWLLQSPYNSKTATKHPLEQAHVWWAEYLYQQIKNRS